MQASATGGQATRQATHDAQTAAGDHAKASSDARLEDTMVAERRRLLQGDDGRMLGAAALP